jgi:hypothetical protein
MPEPLIGPLVGPSVKPFPGTIEVPGMVIPRVNPFVEPKNPFPERSECVEEWAAAVKFCDELVRKGKLGKRGTRGFGDSYYQCVLGQASEDCGGNPIA